MEARGWRVLGLWAPGKEVVHGLVGIGKRVAVRQAAHDPENFVDARRQAFGQSLRGLDAPGGEVFHQLLELRPETVGCAE